MKRSAFPTMATVIGDHSHVNGLLIIVFGSVTPQGLIQLVRVTDLVHVGDGSGECSMIRPSGR